MNSAPRRSGGTLIVFGGLPGTGKTTISRALARTRRATYLRIDTIEPAICGRDLAPEAGCGAALALAALNLQVGGTVVADAVNPLVAVRDAWRGIASEAGARLLEVELIRERGEAQAAWGDAHPGHHRSRPAKRDRILDRAYEP